MLKNRFILAVLAICNCAIVSPVAGYTIQDGVDDKGNPTKIYTGDFTSVTLYTGTGADKKGYIGGAPLWSVVESTNITIDGENTKVTEVMGEGFKSCVVTGDKTINIKNGYVATVVGGADILKQASINYTPNKDKNFAGGDKGTYSDSYLFPDKTEASIFINVSGGKVGQIRGGHNNGEAAIAAEIAAARKVEKLDELMENQPWAFGGDVNISITGGMVGVDEEGNATGEDAVRGAGGSRHSVEGAVNISISGDDTKVYGDVYAGGRSTVVSSGGMSGLGVVSTSYVGRTFIDIDGGTIDGNVFAGSSCDEEDWSNSSKNTQSLTKNAFSGVSGSSVVSISKGTVTKNVYGAGNNDTVLGSSTVELIGGSVCGDVYAGGIDSYIGMSKEDNVEKGTKVIISENGTAVAGTIYGGSHVSDDSAGDIVGDRLLEVSSTHEGTQSYKLADFKNIEVAGDLALEKLLVAEDADGTSVDVKSGGSITTTAGVLTGLNKLNVDGTLNVDMNGADATADAVSGKVLTLGDNAVINVSLDGAEAANEIALFGFEELNSSEKVTITLNGSLVDDGLWDFMDGSLVIQEASSSTLTLSRNQSAFYAAVQSMHAAGDATPELAELAASRDSEAVKAAIDALSGHEYATAMSSQMEGNLGHLRRLRGAMGKGTALGSYVSFANCYVDNKVKEVLAPTPVTDSRNWRVGASAFHEETSVDSDARGDGYDRSETGAMLTAEYYVSEGVTLGGALSYGRTNLRTDGARRRHEDNTRFDVYALYGANRWSFATSLGLGVHDHELERGKASADADGYSVNFMQDVACTVVQGEKSSVQLFGTLESSWNNMDSFNDGMLLADEQDAWATEVTAGVRYNRALPAVCSKAPVGVFTVQTGVTASIGDVKSGLDLSMDGYSYRQESASRNRWGWNVGAGVDVPVRANVSVYVTADAVLRGDSSSVDGQVGVRVSF